MINKDELEGGVKTRARTVGSRGPHMTDWGPEGRRTGGTGPALKGRARVRGQCGSR